MKKVFFIFLFIFVIHNTAEGHNILSFSGQISKDKRNSKHYVNCVIEMNQKGTVRLSLMIPDEGDKFKTVSQISVSLGDNHRDEKTGIYGRYVCWDIWQIVDLKKDYYLKASISASAKHKGHTHKSVVHLGYRPRYPPTPNKKPVLVQRDFTYQSIYIYFTNSVPTKSLPLGDPNETIILNS